MNQEDPFEAIVVGSGATGGVAALTLAKAGIKVLVVEAGPEFSLKQVIGWEPLNTIKRIIGVLGTEQLKQAQHPGYWKSNPSLYVNEKDNPYTYPKENPFIWTQGRQVGGRSLTWGGITLRLSNSDFEAPKIDGYGKPWPINYLDLEKHYTALEKLFSIYGKKDDLDQLPDGVYSTNLPFTKSEKFFAKKIRSELNYPVINSRGFGPFDKNNKDEWPISCSIGSTLKLAIETGNVEILKNHLVEYITMNNSQDLAKGLVAIDQLSGQRKILRGKLIVLCSSTIQTVKILLNSESKNRTKGFSDPSNNLGCYLMDHISTCRFFSMPNMRNSKEFRANNNSNKLSGAGSFFIPFGKELDRNEKVDFIRGYGIWGAIGRFEPPEFLKRKPGSSTGFLIGHGEVLPYKDNRITLSKKLDKWGIPIPHIDCKWQENERNMVNHMNKIIVKCIKTSGGDVLPLKDIFKMPFIEPIVAKSLAVQENAPPPGYYIHEVGGAAMGTKKENSVVDKWNRLWECKNVLVVDGACWPTSSWQSPTLTMMAITRRACLQAVKDQKA